MNPFAALESQSLDFVKGILSPLLDVLCMQEIGQLMLVHGVGLVWSLFCVSSFPSWEGARYDAANMNLESSSILLSGCIFLHSLAPNEAPSFVSGCDLI